MDEAESEHHDTGLSMPESQINFLFDHTLTDLIFLIFRVPILSKLPIFWKWKTTESSDLVEAIIALLRDSFENWMIWFFQITLTSTWEKNSARNSIQIGESVGRVLFSIFHNTCLLCWLPPPLPGQGSMNVEQTGLTKHLISLEIVLIIPAKVVVWFCCLFSTCQLPCELMWARVNEQFC